MQEARSQTTGWYLRHREGLVLTAIILLAFVVRVLFLSAWADTALFFVPMGDSKNFHDTALALLGLGPPVGAFLFQPLYSFYLAAVYSVFGVSVAAARTVQLFFGVLACIPIYLLGRRLAGVWAGRLAVLWYALYGPMIFLGSMMLAPALVVPLFALALWSLLEGLERGNHWFLLLAGVSFGLACMGRPNLAVLLPVAGLWILFRMQTARNRLLASAAAVVGLLAGLAPSWVYNASHGQGLIPVSSSGGINFFIGNNPEASGRFHIPASEKAKKFAGITHWQFRLSTRAIAEQAKGRRLSPSEVSDYWYRRGLEFWRERPLAALRLVGRKLMMSLSDGEMAVHHPYEFAKVMVPWLRWLPGFGVLFSFAVLGLVLGGRDRRLRWLLAMLAAYWATLLVFFVADRFRVVMLPILVPLAAACMVRLSERAREHGWWRCWPHLLLLLAAFVVTQNPTYDEAVAKKYIARGYNRLGKAEADMGRYNQALRHFEKSMKIHPTGLTYMNIASIHARLGHYRQAEKMYRKVAEGDPAMKRSALLKLAHLAEIRGDLKGAIKWLEKAAGLMVDPDPVKRRIELLERRLREAGSGARNEKPASQRPPRSNRPSVH